MDLPAAMPWTLAWGPVLWALLVVACSITILASTRGLEVLHAAGRAFCQGLRPLHVSARKSAAALIAAGDALAGSWQARQHVHVAAAAAMDSGDGVLQLQGRKQQAGVSVALLHARPSQQADELEALLQQFFQSSERLADWVASGGLQVLGKLMPEVCSSTLDDPHRHALVLQVSGMHACSRSPPIHAR